MFLVMSCFLLHPGHCRQELQMALGGADASPVRWHGSCTLTHGCIGPTHPFHIKTRLLHRQDRKIWLFCYIRILIRDIPLLECPGWDPCTDLWFVKLASRKFSTLKLLFAFFCLFLSQGLRTLSRNKCKHYCLAIICCRHLLHVKVMHRGKKHLHP